MPPQSEPHRIALVSPRYPPAIGGVERHVAELATRLARRGLSVDVVCTDPTGTLQPLELLDGVTVRRFGTIANDGVFFVAPELARWLWREAGAYDIVHAHSYHTPLALAAAAAARRHARPFVVTPHYHGGGHSPFRSLLHGPYRPLGARVVRGARAVICVSEAERLLIARDFGVRSRAIVIPNGVDLERIRASGPATQDARRLVLAIGRLEAYKRVDRLIAAAACLPLDYRVVVVGEGPEAAALERLVTSTGVAGRVELAGRVAQSVLDGWLRSADVIVSLSTAEAFGLTLLEGAAGGARVVASDIPAHREVAAFLPPGAVTLVPGDAGPEEIATAIAGARERHLDAAEVAAGVPTWDGMARAVLDVYRRCCGANGGAASG